MSSHNSEHVFVIAEVGVNHNGDLETAIELVHASIAAGADAVKFQTFDANALVTADAQLAPYQVRASNATSSQRELLEALCLSPSDHREIARVVRSHGREFLSTPFDVKSLDFLIDDLGMGIIKIPSGEITNLPYLVEVASRHLPMLVSTGMSTTPEVARALHAVAFGRDLGRQPRSKEEFTDFVTNMNLRVCDLDVTLLHCTSEYPAPMEHLNLRAIETLQSEFGCPIGYSDHSLGVEAALGAVALGATVIEKHITLDQTQVGPDHAASSTPEEFSVMVSGIRRLSVALGDGVKAPRGEEHVNATVVRRSVVSARDIQQGEQFQESYLELKRPALGLPPEELWSLTGHRAARDISAGTLISKDDL